MRQQRRGCGAEHDLHLGVGSRLQLRSDCVRDCARAGDLPQRLQLDKRCFPSWHVRARRVAKWRRRHHPGHASYLESDSFPGFIGIFFLLLPGPDLHKLDEPYLVFLRSLCVKGTICANQSLVNFTRFSARHRGRYLKSIK